MIQGAMMGLVSIALAFFNSYLIEEASTGDFRISWHLAVKGGGGGVGVGGLQSFAGYLGLTLVFGWDSAAGGGGGVVISVSRVFGGVNKIFILVGDWALGFIMR